MTLFLDVLLTEQYAARSVRDAKRTRNHIGMYRWKCLLCELWLKEAEKKIHEITKKQEHVIVRKKIFKGFTTKGVQNYIGM